MKKNALLRTSKIASYWGKKKGWKEEDTVRNSKDLRDLGEQEKLAFGREGGGGTS